jgi:hypothetical protein
LPKGSKVLSVATRLQPDEVKAIFSDVMFSRRLFPPRGSKWRPRKWESVGDGVLAECVNVGGAFMLSQGNREKLMIGTIVELDVEPSEGGQGTQAHLRTLQGKALLGSGGSLLTGSMEIGKHFKRFRNEVQRRDPSCTATWT